MPPAFSCPGPKNVFTHRHVSILMSLLRNEILGYYAKITRSLQLLSRVVALHTVSNFTFPWTTYEIFSHYYLPAFGVIRLLILFSVLEETIVSMSRASSFLIPPQCDETDYISRLIYHMRLFGALLIWIIVPALFVTYYRVVRLIYICEDKIFYQKHRCCANVVFPLIWVPFIFLLKMSLEE